MGFLFLYRNDGFCDFFDVSKNIQRYVLQKAQENLGIDTNISDEDKTLRELELEGKIEKLEKELERIEIKEEIKKEMLSQTITPMPSLENEDEEVYTDLPQCVDQCGDGECAEIVCMGSGCPCAEDFESCPEDCKEYFKNHKVNLVVF
jgi:hypothetical protein